MMEAGDIFRSGMGMLKTEYSNKKIDEDDASSILA
jgi:hypothetical protein